MCRTSGPAKIVLHTAWKVSVRGSCQNQSQEIRLSSQHPASRYALQKLAMSLSIRAARMINRARRGFWRIGDESVYKKSTREL
jgi:hypothetical protein